jgi:hypothetical protein
MEPSQCLRKKTTEATNHCEWKHSMKFWLSSLWIRRKSCLKSCWKVFVLNVNWAQCLWEPGFDLQAHTHTQTKRYVLTMCSWSHCAWVSMWLIHLLSVSSIKWQLHLYLALRVVRISWQPRWELLSKVLEFTTAFKNRYCIIYLFLPCILNFGFINLRRIAGFWNRSIL